MIEVLVSMTLSLLVVMAAAAVLLMSKQGFSTLDGASQLKDNIRFATDIVRRVVQQAGFRDISNAGATRATEIRYVGMPSDTEPAYVEGFNNSIITRPTDPLSNVAHNTRNATTGKCSTATDSACVNGSDVLVIRFQTSASIEGGATNDQSMINCAGTSDPGVPMNRSDRMTNIMYVDLSQGEPALMCLYQTVGPTGAKWNNQPLVQGVESFQVLYGVDDVSPAGGAGNRPDGVAERYLRADEMTASGDAAAIRANWLRVRSLRIGLVLRAAEGTALEKKTQDFYPLGVGAWNAAQPTADPGAKFAAPADGRFRQSFTFTVYLPNRQEL